MNDIVLSSLLNLFALFGAGKGVGKEESLPLISSYLSRFYGIRNLKSYTRLYSDLRDFYDDFPQRESVLNSICTNLKGHLKPIDGAMFLLRLMEFLSKTTSVEESDRADFGKVMECFDVSDSTMDAFMDFISGKEGECVRIIPLGNDCGSIKTLYSKETNILVFSYSGDCSIFMDDIQLLPDVFQVWNKSSILKSSHFSPMYYSSIMSVYSREDEGYSMELCGRDINFRFEKGGKNGIHNLSFTLRSGELVAIMGGSGVGKSTLLSILNGSLKPQEGSITINGHSLDEPEACSLIGFVPQDDLLIDELTVYQNLYYTAKLCFEDMDESELDSKVMATLSCLELEAARDLQVGSPINKFISGGQRKRLNIALELIREPAVLYLDEPTSGLSSADSEKVVNILKELTRKGKLIVVNIHQPSSDVYKLFDRLWLMDTGGYPVYDGNPIEAISHFKMLAGYADCRTSTCPVCGNVNPEIVLNIINEKIVGTTGQMTEERKVSPQEWHKLYLDDRKEMPDVKISPVPPSDQKRPGALKQMWIFLRRNISAKLTNLQYILLTLLEAPALALVCGLLTRYAPIGKEYTLMDNKNFPSFIFMAIIVSIFLGMSGSAEEIIRDRSLLKREKFLHLSYGSYISSKIVFMGFVCLLQTLLFTIVGTWIIGVHGMFFHWWLILFASEFLSGLIGLLLSQTLNSVVAIYITIPLLLIPQILLCGLVVKFEDLTPNSRTGNAPIIGDFIPSRWSYEALAVASFSMTDYESEFFEKDSERFQARYYLESFIYELESRMETIQSDSRLGKEEDPRHREVLRTELPHLARICGMENYAGDYDYDSVMAYLKEAGEILSRRSNEATLELDRMISGRIRECGKDALLELKRNCYNLQLENLVLNMNTDKVYTVVKGHIVPRSGYIYLTPRSHNGRAPFYSGVKVIGDTRIPTFWFDLMVILAMCVVIGTCLYTDFPGKMTGRKKK